MATPKRKGLPVTTLTVRQPMQLQWNDQIRKAAQLIVAGKPYTQVAEQIGVTLNTIHVWRRRPVFDAYVRRLQKRADDEAVGLAICNKAARFGRLNERWVSIDDLIKARGREMDGEVAGGETGLLVRDYKGKDADRTVYKADTALLKEERELAKQAAIELGEWAERKTPDDLEKMTDEQLDELGRSLWVVEGGKDSPAEAQA